MQKNNGKNQNQSQTATALALALTAARSIPCERPLTPARGEGPTAREKALDGHERKMLTLELESSPEAQAMFLRADIAKLQRGIALAPMTGALKALTAIHTAAATAALKMGRAPIALQPAPETVPAETAPETVPAA